MIFAQQAAAALTETEHRRLTGTMRGVLLWTFLIWVVIAAGSLVFSNRILNTLHISPAALLVTVLLGLVTMWKPVFYGVLQGTQSFFWLGWASIVSGVGRLTAVAFIVLLLGGRAAGMMAGALLGETIALAIGAWRSHVNWSGPKEPVQWRPWLGRVVPLTLGFGAFQFMFMIDPMFVRAFFDESQTGGYVAAGTLSRALVLFTGPLAAVMFPKIVRSLASSQKTNMLKVTLLTTAALAGLGALFIAYLLPIGLRLFFKGAFIAGIPLLPPFAASMAVLTLANVLINNLLARGKFQVVPWLIVIVASYALTLFKFHTSVEQVIYTLGLFSVLMTFCALYFTWRIGSGVKVP
jgi:O-antigen/teichoic acid export membrane protein